MKIQRWMIDPDEKCDTGDWVLWEDVEQLQVNHDVAMARIDAQNQEIDALRELVKKGRAAYEKEKAPKPEPVKLEPMLARQALFVAEGLCATDRDVLLTAVDIYERMVAMNEMDPERHKPWNHDEKAAVECALYEFNEKERKI